MKRINLVGQAGPGAWSRLFYRVHDMRLNGKHVEMRQAYAAMALEQRQEGSAAGFLTCDLPWCGCAASHKWTRTAAEIKASRVKRNKVTVQMEPESIRCEKHVPDWRAGQYARLAVSLPVAA